MATHRALGAPGADDRSSPTGVTCDDERVLLSATGSATAVGGAECMSGRVGPISLIDTQSLGTARSSAASKPVAKLGQLQQSQDISDQRQQSGVGRRGHRMSAYLAGIRERVRESRNRCLAPGCWTRYTGFRKQGTSTGGARHDRALRDGPPSGRGRCGDSSRSCPGVRLPSSSRWRWLSAALGAAARACRFGAVADRV